MAFLAADRDTVERAHPGAHYHHILAKDSKQYYKGQLVGVDLDDGKLVGVTAGDLTIQAVGRCEENVLTGTSNTRKIKVKSGCFRWASGASAEAITAAHRGQVCYVIDDQTVGISGATGANMIAGRIEDVNTGGVDVFTMWPLPQLAPVGPTGV